MTTAINPHINSVTVGVETAALELERREREALHVFRPLPHQRPIYENDAKEVIIRGGNRSSKTINAAMKVVSEALRIPVQDGNGNSFPLFTPARPLLIWAIGYDEEHIGTTIYDRLFEPGLFRVLRDEVTHKWRTYRPWVPEDCARKNETKPAEPLISPRFILGEPAWSEKKRHIIKSITLVNGTVIRFYSSRAKAKQGDDVDIIWIDEDIEEGDHMIEWQMRLLDRNGRLIWSALPHSKNNALVEMSERADKQRDSDKPRTIEHVLDLRDNPYIDPDEISSISGALSEEQARQRIEGKFTFDTQLVYPTYHKTLHLCPRPNQDSWDAIDRIVESRERPKDWCRYMAIDPGFQTCAVLFAAVPPPEMFGNWVVVEGELYLHRQNIDQIVQQIGPWIYGFVYEEFVIDWHAGRITPLTGGPTYAEQFQKKFEEYKFSSRNTGSGFRKGNDNIDSRVNLVRAGLESQPATGVPTLRINRYTTKHGLQREFPRYKYVVSQGLVTDKVRSVDDHAMDCLGYLMSLPPVYHYPSPTVQQMPTVVKAFLDLKARSHREIEQRNKTVWLGPGNA
jgi:hypothetical protein